MLVKGKPAVEKIAVVVTAVDLPNRAVSALDKTGAPVKISFRNADTLTLIPAAGERWSAIRYGYLWYLDRKLDETDMQGVNPGDTRVSAQTLHISETSMQVNGLPYGPMFTEQFTADSVKTSFTLTYPATGIPLCFSGGKLINPAQIGLNGKVVSFSLAPTAGALVISYQVGVGAVVPTPPPPLNVDAAIVVGIGVPSASDVAASVDAFMVSAIGLASATDTAIFVDAGRATGIGIPSTSDTTVSVDSGVVTGIGAVPSGVSVSYSGTVISDGPIAYYRLDEASGTSILDLSGNSRTATLWGSAARYTQAVTGLITGDADKAIKFDAGTRAGTTPGTDDAGIDLPLGIPSAFGAGGAHSMEAWVEVDHLSWEFQGMILVAGGGIGGLLTNTLGETDDASADAAYASANFAFLVFDSNGNAAELDAPTFATSPIGERFHLVGTFDGVDTLSIYVNGALVASGSFQAYTGFAYSGAPYPYEANGARFAIGNANQAQDAVFAPGTAGSAEWAGTIDEVAIYPSALSATRVLAHYNAGASGSSAADTAIFVDSGTVTGVAIVTSAESRLYGDGSTVSGTAIASATDTVIFVDSGTATGIGIVTGTEVYTTKIKTALGFGQFYFGERAT